MKTFPRIAPELADAYRASGAWRDRLCHADLLEAVERRGDQTALVDRAGVMTWAELASAARGFAGALRERGLGEGDVVSWILPNWREAAIAHWGVLLLGGVSNPIVPIYRHREVRYILDQAGTGAVVIPGDFRGFDYEAMIEELGPELPTLRSVFTVEGSGRNDDFATAIRDAEPAAHDGGDADAPALLLYTSGTTADPKGAIHTHNTLDFELRSMIEFYGLDAGAVIYMPSPLSHVTGLLYGIQMPAMLGASAVLQDQFEPATGLALVADHGCTFSVGATPFLHGLCEAQEAAPRTLALETFVCGGADVPAELIRRASQTLGCRATRAYGSTEFPTVTGGNADDPEARRAETDGRVFDHCEVRVVDERGAIVPDGTPGELQARGPELFPGYLAGAGSDAIDADGWFSTGDLVSIEDGYLTVEGRIKDVILRGGENISVKEVADLLYEHPEVAEVAIVAMPDPRLTERACAYVVPEAGRTPSLADLVAHLETHRMARQKLPERLELVTELPKTASGKVQKHVLRTRIRERLEAEG